MVEKTTIEIRKEPTYKRLNARKGPGESFDDVVTQLLDDVDGQQMPGYAVPRDELTDQELATLDDVDDRAVPYDADDRADQELDVGGDQEGTPVTCHKCDYSWTYSGSKNRATCPNCKSTVKVD